MERSNCPGYSSSASLMVVISNAKTMVEGEGDGRDWSYDSEELLQ